MKKIILIGAGTHLLSVVDSINPEAFEVVGVLDNRLNVNCEYFKIPVLGRMDDLSIVKKVGADKVFITLGDLKMRQDILKDIEKNNIEMVSIIDETAIIAKNVEIGSGTFVGKGVIINTYGEVGKACIINSGCIIEHNCTLGYNVHIAPGATLCGNVKIGNNTMVGANATIIQTKRIGNDIMIGANTTVLSDIKDGKVVVGSPAREIF